MARLVATNSKKQALACARDAKNALSKVLKGDAGAREAYARETAEGRELAVPEVVGSGSGACVTEPFGPPVIQMPTGYVKILVKNLEASEEEKLIGSDEVELQHFDFRVLNPNANANSDTAAGEGDGKDDKMVYVFDKQGNVKLDKAKFELLMLLPHPDVEGYVVKVPFEGRLFDEFGQPPKGYVIGICGTTGELRLKRKRG